MTQLYMYMSIASICQNKVFMKINLSCGRRQDSTESCVKMKYHFFWKDNLNLFMLDNCGDLNKNDPHWLIGLNTWSLGVALLAMD